LQDAISLQLLGHLATQIEDLGGILPLHRVAEHVLAEAANAFVQCAAAALRLHPVKRTKLAGGSQEDGVKSFCPGIQWILSTFGQCCRQAPPIEHLVEIGFELVTLQSQLFSFSPLRCRKRRRLMWPMVAAAP
jgi:hypothetical protein